MDEKELLGLVTAVRNGSDRSFKTLVAAVQAAGLVETLQGEGPFTVFAPTNAAFEAAFEALGITAEELLADTETLTSILTYHVVEGAVPSSDVVTLDGEMVPTLNGASVTISVDGDTVMVDDATVTAVDIAAQPVLCLMGQLNDLGLHANVVQADLLHWQPAEPFDAIYEQTCLCALDPGHWRDYEQRVADWLLPGGRLLALFMQTGHDGGPPFDCALPDMRDLFVATRWDWPDRGPLEVAHPNGFTELGYVLTRR